MAKSPNVMAGPPRQSELRFEGASVLHVTSTGPDGSKTVLRLQRAE